MTHQPCVLFLITEDWYFWSHRLDLAKAIRDAGMEVLVVTRVQDHGARIEKEGFRLIPIRMRRRNRQPLRELLSVLELVRIYRREQPDLVHHVAMKPMLYGSIAARLAGVPAVVNAFAGLGYAFITDHQSAKVLRFLIGRALRWALALPRSRVIVQNDVDREQLIRDGIVQPIQVSVIRGVGVDTTAFAPSPEPTGPLVVLLGARMLWDKGVGEFVEAMRKLKARGLDLRGVLVGMVDEDNPACISQEQLRSWQATSVVEWWGRRDDMPRVLASAHVVVLPSYREGLPKVLLEAAACARPIVATDVPGCREIVQDGRNGLLVPPRDAGALAEAINTLVQDQAMRLRMGARGREIVTREFSAEQVARETLAVYRELLER
ncbi:MAG: glycosyl transferase family 1 [Nitrospirae bacterium RIFCSPLOWO2_02_FULL_62_14]|nr:MAG: glycosyl transferase family 1 [Nitrospirae bacterium RIFCSPLOWO2_02_FULL_62_14]